MSVYDCTHPRKEASGIGGIYCLDCGARMLPAPPKPSPAYFDHITDSRELNWRALDDHHGVAIQPHKTYIGALYLEDARAWALVRVQWCDDCGHWEVAQALDLNSRCHAPAPITHLADDLLGTPRLSR